MSTEKKNADGSESEETADPDDLVVGVRSLFAAMGKTSILVEKPAATWARDHQALLVAD